MTPDPVVQVALAPDAVDRFARAIEISRRFLDNIETVVHGKREEVKLVLAALACEGHVLFEDVPGTSSSRTWPRDTRAARTSLTSSRFPWTTVSTFATRRSTTVKTRCSSRASSRGVRSPSTAQL